MQRWRNYDSLHHGMQLLPFFETHILRQAQRWNVSNLGKYGSSPFYISKLNISVVAPKMGCQDSPKHNTRTTSIMLLYIYYCYHFNPGLANPDWLFPQLDSPEVNKIAGCGFVKRAPSKCHALLSFSVNICHLRVYSLVIKDCSLETPPFCWLIFSFHCDSWGIPSTS